MKHRGDEEAQLPAHRELRGVDDNAADRVAALFARNVLVSITRRRVDHSDDEVRGRSAAVLKVPRQRRAPLEDALRAHVEHRERSEGLEGCLVRRVRCGLCCHLHFFRRELFRLRRVLHTERA